MTKLYYKKKDYPTVSLTSNYDRCLSDGSFMIFALAQSRFPQGIRLHCGMDIEAGIKQTCALLTQSTITIFEPLLYADRKIARPFVMQKQADRLTLTHLSTKCSDKHQSFRNFRSGRIQSVWYGLLESVAFHHLICQEMFPHYTICSQILQPDRSFRAAIHGLDQGFMIEKNSDQTILSRLSGVTLHDPHHSALENYLRLTEVQSEVEEIIPRLRQELSLLLPQMQDKVSVPLDKHCKNCEFRGNADDPRDGFEECWGALAHSTPHIFDLYHGTRLYAGEESMIRRLITQGKASYLDVPLECIEDSAHGHRQRIQILCTRQNREWISDKLLEIIDQWQYPLHFIDFETARLAIPPRAHLAPFTQIAFQWSCHRIDGPQAVPQHHSWLNLEDSYPNLSFAQSLIQCLGSTGTIFTWGMHERSILCEIYHQLMQLHHAPHESGAVQEWLKQKVVACPPQASPFVDLHALTLKYYFHPHMKGRTSLKYVLPAIWQHHEYLHQIPWLQAYLHHKDGVVQNPYTSLGKQWISDREVVIQEGMEAALAYQEVHFSKGQDHPNWRPLLEQYCCLDTIAMVIVWLHWQHLSTAS